MICIISYHIPFRFNGENESKYESGDQSFDSRSNSTKIEIRPTDNNLDGNSKRSGGSEGEGSGEDKFNYQFIYNEQGNQLKVENPADFKNGEWNGSSFEKAKFLNGINVNGILKCSQFIIPIIHIKILLVDILPQRCFHSRPCR